LIFVICQLCIIIIITIVTTLFSLSSAHTLKVVLVYTIKNFFPVYDKFTYLFTVVNNIKLGIPVSKQHL